MSFYKMRGGFAMNRPSFRPTKTGYSVPLNKAIVKYVPKSKSTWQSGLNKAGNKLGNHLIKKGFEAAENFGISVVNSLFENTPDNQNKPIPLKGSIVDGLATGAISETKFKSHAPFKHSKALTTVLQMGNRQEFSFQQNYAVGNSSTSVQAVSDLCLANGNPAAAFGVVPQQTYSYANGFFTGDINTASTTVGGVLTTLNQLGPAGGIVPSSRMFVKGATNTMTINNSNSYAQMVDIYECVAKHDFTGINSSVFGTTGIGTWSPTTFWSFGLIETALPNVTPSGLVVGKETSLSWGGVPTQSDLFNIFWDISSKVSVMMPAGSYHKHISTYNLNMVLANYRWQFSGILQGVTRNIMVVVRGMALPGPTFVRETVPQVSITNECCYSVQALTNSAKSVTYANTSTI